ncbi:MAG: hypothetical protein IH614_01230 [Desulfuromonadales bacterium]|nr:hypothetical protein [Desulfuromonadales bacterium]
MSDKRCSDCCMLYPEEELLLREDDGQLVCPDCSRLNEDDLLTCTYDEVG